MKKLRLNNIFHWLYAGLLFLPFILFVCNVIGCFGTLDISQSYDYLNNVFYNSIPVGLFDGTPIGEPIETAIENVFLSFIRVEFDSTYITDSVYALFIYWVEVSFAYLLFDVLMFLINLAHRWIDRGSDL